MERVGIVGQFEDYSGGFRWSLEVGRYLLN